MATRIELESGGTVWKVLVTAGQEVQAGQELFILEVMKMEVPYTAPVAGRLLRLDLSEADVVEEGQMAAEIG